MLSTIKNFTNNLLKNKPDYWTTRLPWVIIIGLAVHILLGAMVMVTEWDVRFDTEYEIWVSFITIIILLALVFYLIFLLRFNVFKRFGQLSPMHYVGTFLIFLLTMALCVSWGYNPSAVTTLSARVKYDDTKIASDINRINTLINTLEYDSIPHLWTRQKVVLETERKKLTSFNDIEFKNGAHNYEQADYYDDAIEDGYKKVSSYLNNPEDNFYTDGRVSHLDSAAFNKVQSTDSIQRIDDVSLYRFYSPDYTYVTDYHEFFGHTKVEESDSKEMFQKTIETKLSIQNRPELEKELKNLIATYWAFDHGYYYNNYKNENYTLPFDFRHYINRKYRIYDLDEGIKNISDRYYMWDFHKLGFLVYPLYYISMVMAIILFLFRHCRKKSFFYTLLAGVVIFIFSVTLLAFSGSGQAFVLGLMVFYMILFGVIGLSIFNAKRKTLVQDIGLNLFIFFTPVYLTLITAVYYFIKKEIFKSNHYGKNNYSDMYSEAFKYEDLFMQLSIVSGFVLFIVLLQFVYSKLLRKSYALPEN